jgi:hypothetical protein
MFYGRSLLIATQHQKETVIAPIFEEGLELSCFISDVFNTDTLGTFSGEIRRQHDALTTLRNKCIFAMQANNCDLVIASEGSFGPHPTIFFAHANEELVMLIDSKNNLEIVAREISLETNFNGQTIENTNELLEFASNVKFPSHGIILKPAENNYSVIHKGINSESVLIEKFQELKKEFGTVYAESDMRAMYNPTRMKVIEKAAQKLLEKIKNQCPECKTPGFDIVKVKSGLPCENCYSPTRSTLCHVYQCKKCNHQKENMYPRGIQHEDAMYCDNCNP